MATEPMSLGMRFRRHVAGWVMDSVPTPPPGELEALEARADAAERLAVASSRYIATIDGQRAWTTGTDSDLSEALAAWRALGEVQP